MKVPVALSQVKDTPDDGQVALTLDTGVPPAGGYSEKTRPISRAFYASGAAARRRRGSAMWLTGAGRPGSSRNALYTRVADTS